MKFVTNINNLFSDNKNIILYFYSNKTPYHDKFITMISLCEKENNFVNFTAINIECEKKLNTRFNFKSVPCLIFYSNDIEVYRYEGMMSTKKLKNLISKFYLGEKYV